LCCNHSRGRSIKRARVAIRCTFSLLFAALFGGCSFGVDLAPFYSGVDSGAADAGTRFDAGDNEASALIDASTKADVEAGRLRYMDMILADTPQAYLRLGDPVASVSARDSTANQKDAIYEPGSARGALGAIAQDPDTAANVSGGGLVAPNRLDFSGRAAFSLEAWALFAVNDGQFRHIFQKDSYPDTGREQFGIYLQNANGLVFERHVAGMPIKVVAAAPSPGRWHHIVATYDGSMSTLYVDGVVANAAADARNQLDKDVPLYLGQNTPTGGYWAGSIDEVAIYSRALAAADVARHFASGLGQ
jgi:Concanavalin A-like lectin/glucanases superfamily